MRLPGRVAAAIEILTEVLERHRPASEVLKDWGKAHRFAGSGDRHGIGTLVYDGLRKKNSSAAASGAASPRGIILGVLRHVWKLDVAMIAALMTEQHGPGALTVAETVGLSATPAMPPHVAGDFPEWLAPSFARVFGERIVEETMALAARAPIDLRVNTLKATRAQLLESLQRLQPVEGPLSPWSVRIAAPGPEQKHVSVEAEPAHGMGWFEVQDSASQIAALLSGVKAGEKVADICAGAGGKTLALAAMMQNEGVLVAHDMDKRRLRPIFERLTRAGASCVQVVAADVGSRLAVLGPYDCVLIDAPCSGSGSWRRKPDAKWKLSAKLLGQRTKDQRDVLAAGAKLVRPGGRLVYVTCSVLPEENQDQVTAFLAAYPGFRVVPYARQWEKVVDGAPPVSAAPGDAGLLLTPARHGTDGFYVAVLQHAG